MRAAFECAKHPNKSGFIQSFFSSEKRIVHQFMQHGQRTVRFVRKKKNVTSMKWLEKRMTDREQIIQKQSDRAVFTLRPIIFHVRAIDALRTEMRWVSTTKCLKRVCYAAKVSPLPLDDLKVVLAVPTKRIHFFQVIIFGLASSLVITTTAKCSEINNTLTGVARTKQV